MEPSSFDFSTLRYDGKRFTGHTLPLALAADLAAYSEVIWDTARWLFKKENPARQRVPRGFSDDISLHLEQVEEGSTGLKIILLASSQTLFAPYQTVLEKARDTVERAVSVAAHPKDGVALKSILPVPILKKLGKIGRNLEPGEELFFGAAPLSQTTRETILFDAGERRVARALQLRARIVDLNQDTKTGKLKDMADAVLDFGKISDESYAAVREGWIGYTESKYLLLSGTGYFNRQGQPESFEIETADELDALDIGVQLAGIAQLPEGWYDGEGDAYDKEQLETVTRLFDEHFSPAYTLPYVFPVATGGLQLEWDSATASVQLEWPLDGSPGYLFGLDKSTKEISEENDLNLKSEDTFRKLHEALQAYNFLETKDSND